MGFSLFLATVLPRTLAIIVLALACVVGFAPRAQGQTATPCDRYANGVVFVGVAGAPERRTAISDAALPPWPALVTPMRIVRAFRGVSTSLLYVRLLDGDALDEGREYLIYAEENVERVGGASLVTNLFHYTMDEAQADLRFLEEAASGTATIYGRLRSGDPDDESRPRQPLPNVTLRVSAEDFSAEVVTSEDGEFVVAGVPEGFARVETLLPDHLMVRQSGVMTRGGSCERLELFAILNGRVRGRVLRHDGRPLHGYVDLLPADRQVAARESLRRVRVRTDEYGDFEFSGQPPGAYLIGVNLLHPPDLSAPYKPTYYAGTVDRGGAETILIGDGTLREGVDVVLTDQLRRGRLEVVVDGNVFSATTLCVSQPGHEFATVAGAYTNVSAEPVAFDVLEGQRYRLRAHSEGRASHVESDEVELTAAAGLQKLTLRPNRPARAHPPDQACWNFWDGLK